MGWQVIIGPSARSDRAEIVRYLAHHNSDAATRLGFEVITRAEGLASFPEMGRQGRNPADLASRRKSDPANLKIAAWLRRETTLSIKPIAGRLHLGAAPSASVRLHAAMSQSTPAQPAQGAQGHL